jgi:hypothetical protein
MWQGEQDGYQRLPDPVTHKRTVLALGQDRWLVVDHLHGRQNHHYALHWLLNDFPYEQQASSVILALRSLKCKIHFGLLKGIFTFSVVRGDPNSTRGWRSRYYGDKEPAISVLLETDQPGVCFWTFFGFEEDTVQIEEETFRLLTPEQKTSINLPSLRTNY